MAYCMLDTKVRQNAWDSGNKKLKAYISFKQIDQLKISGACDVYIKGTIESR